MMEFHRQLCNIKTSVFLHEMLALVCIKDILNP